MENKITTTTTTTCLQEWCVKLLKLLRWNLVFVINTRQCHLPLNYGCVN